MNNKPILFNTDMVKAILSGRKTQTRRIVKPQPEPFCTNGFQWDGHRPNSKYGAMASTDEASFKSMMVSSNCPNGQPGDLLWVRETWRRSVVFLPDRRTTIPIIKFKAGGTGPSIKPLPESAKWKPSIHMPRWASRLTLKITDIRIERVQDISEQEAYKEGVNPDKETNSYKDSFMFLWDKVYSNWDSNPWVWVIEFEVIQKNIDEVLKASS